MLDPGHTRLCLTQTLKHMLPSCSKHFHRLYHNTRDCSTPAYYKRCARLLTRLAMSPLCTQS
uniref:ALK and LTK ligand 1 n=2 Tax=Accipitrinae TaxID=8955 RepID=A0A663E389_AQUCH